MRRRRRWAGPRTAMHDFALALREQGSARRAEERIRAEYSALPKKERAAREADILRRHETATERRERAAAAAAELALQAKLRPGKMRRVHVVSEGSFHTQGYGAAAYARAAAEMYAADLTAAEGVKAEVREVVHRKENYVSSPWSTGPLRREYEVWAELRGRLEVEALRHRAKHWNVKLRDFVAGCWRRGVNPRVFCPFIPHDYEARVGLDYQGRDKA